MSSLLTTPSRDSQTVSVQPPSVAAVPSLRTCQRTSICELDSATPSGGPCTITGTRSGWVSVRTPDMPSRSEEHTSELQSLMRISYAVFCLNKKKETSKNNTTTNTDTLKITTHHKHNYKK